LCIASRWSGYAYGPVLLLDYPATERREPESHRRLGCWFRHTCAGL